MINKKKPLDQQESLHDTMERLIDALEINDSAVAILGDEILRTIARELLKSVRNSTTIDWTIKESVQATLRRNIRRILRKYGYPPDKQEKAIQTVMEQAKLLAEELV